MDFGRVALADYYFWRSVVLIQFFVRKFYCVFFVIRCGKYNMVEVEEMEQLELKKTEIEEKIFLFLQ